MRVKQLLASLAIVALTSGAATLAFTGCGDDTEETDADTDAAPVGFGWPCEENEDCESGICHPFNSDGPHCTIACDGPEDCPPQNDGSDAKCNNDGVCKTGPGEPEE